MRDDPLDITVRKLCAAASGLNMITLPAVTNIDTVVCNPQHWWEIFTLCVDNQGSEAIWAKFQLVGIDGAVNIAQAAVVEVSDGAHRAGRWIVREGQFLRCSVQSCTYNNLVVFTPMGIHHWMVEDYPDPGSDTPVQR